MYIFNPCFYVPRMFDWNIRFILLISIFWYYSFFHLKKESDIFLEMLSGWMRSMQYCDMAKMAMTLVSFWYLLEAFKTIGILTLLVQIFSRFVLFTQQVSTKSYILRAVQLFYMYRDGFLWYSMFTLCTRPLF